MKVSDNNESILYFFPVNKRHVMKMRQHMIYITLKKHGVWVYFIYFKNYQLRNVSIYVQYIYILP